MSDMRTCLLLPHGNINLFGTAISIPQLLSKDVEEHTENGRHGVLISWRAKPKREAKAAKLCCSAGGRGLDCGTSGTPRRRSSDGRLPARIDPAGLRASQGQKRAEETRGGTGE